MSPPIKTYSDEQKSKLKELYEADVSWKKIERITGISYKHILRNVREMGIAEKKPRITEAQKEQIINLFLDGSNRNQIAKILEITDDSVLKTITDVDLLYIYEDEKIKKTELENKILELYKKGLSFSNIAEIVKCPEWLVPRVLDRSDTVRNRNNSYTIQNHNIFENITTDAVGHLLGFLITDGCVMSKINTISFGLHPQDTSILEGFNELVGSDYPIKIVGRGEVVLRWNSKQMIQDLVKYRVVDRKTFTCFFPKLDTVDAIRGAIKGIIDGDGHVSYDAVKNHIRGTVSVCGMYDVLNGVSKAFSDILGMTYKEPRKHGKSKIYVLTYGAMPDMEKIYKFLYPNVDVPCLMRKREKLEMIYKYKNENSKKYSR